MSDSKDYAAIDTGFIFTTDVLDFELDLLGSSALKTFHILYSKIFIELQHTKLE